MAYLNVRDRRIEARIAYVGPELSGKTTNFERLGEIMRDTRQGKVERTTGDDGDLLALSWQPADTGQFRDCMVHVKVVTERAAASSDRFRAVLADADGVVVVVDAHPSAQQKNLTWLTAVREALAHGTRRDVPLVLQVNKTDLPDAIPTDDVVGGLDAAKFTHVAASAARGVGVVETLEAALSQILASMRTDATHGGSAVDASRAPSSSGSGIDSAHPLLTALRQVLRDTVREHVVELEARLAARLTTRLDSIDRGLEKTSARLAPVDALAARMANVEQTIQALRAEMRDSSAAAEGRTNAVRARLNEMLDELMKR